MCMYNIDGLIITYLPKVINILTLFFIETDSHYFPSIKKLFYFMKGFFILFEVTPQEVLLSIGTK